MVDAPNDGSDQARAALPTGRSLAPDRAALIRADAALAVAKAATIAALDLGGGLTVADRSEVLAVALGTLKELSRTIPW
jgi:hypothetical protein